MKKINRNCDLTYCSHINSDNKCCLFNPDNCLYRQVKKEDFFNRIKILVCSFIIMTLIFIIVGKICLK